MVKCALLVMLVTASTVVASTETVPQGTTLHCRLAETLSTRVCLQGDRFTATVTEPFALNGHDVIPVGAPITGESRASSARDAFEESARCDCRRRGQDLTLVKGTQLNFQLTRDLVIQ